MTYKDNGTKSGLAITKFSLAVNQGKNKDALWLNVVCFKELAEQVNTHTQKGVLVEVSGRLSGSKYKDKYYYEVIAASIKLCETKKTPVAAGFSRVDEDDDLLGDQDEHPF